MVRLIGTFLAVIAWIITGCSPSPLAESWPEARRLGADVPAYRAPRLPDRDATRPGAYQEPTGDLSLRDALAAALMNNPELASFAWEVRVREARALQAGLSPNPQIDVDVENVAGTGQTHGLESAETTVMLSQLIELGGKRAKRLHAATLDRDLAGWVYEARRLAVLTEVAQRFIEVAAAQRQLELSQRRAALAQQLLDAASKRVAAGAAVPLEKSRAAIALATAQVDLRAARRDLATARQRLAATWGSETPSFKTIHADLARIDSIPTAESLAAQVSQNPDMARWAVELAQRQAVVALARANAVPDVTAGVGVRRLSESNDTAAVFQLSVPLPLSDRNQGGVLEARYAAAKAEQDRRAAELRVRTTLAASYAQLRFAHDEAVTLKRDVLPSAQSTFDAVNKAYQLGQVGYLEAIDAQRSLIELEQRYVEALASYHQAAAQIEGLIGQSLHDLTEQPEAQPNHDAKGNDK